MKDFLLKHLWHETWWHRGGRHFYQWFKKHFIPHKENDHLPQALRTRLLKIYAIVLIAVKIFVTVFLFVIYPSTIVFGGKIADGVIELVNQTRLESGIEELQVNELLVQAAQAKADDMIAQGYFSHTAPNGDKPWAWIDNARYLYYAAGENLAMDFSSAEAVHQAFMNSPTHRKNIVNPRYQEIGVAVAYGEMAGRKTAVLVQYFGSTQKYSVSKLAKVDIKHKTSEVEKDITASPTVAGEEEILVRAATEPYAVSQAVGQTEAGQKVKTIEEFNSPLIVSVSETNMARDIVNKIVLTADKFYYAFLIFLIIALLLKIFIQIRTQHPQIIGYTLSLILLTGVLVMGKWHFVEKIAGRMMEIV